MVTPEFDIRPSVLVGDTSDIYLQRALTVLRNEGEILIPVIHALREQTGLAGADCDFICSGSSDYLAGQSFAFVSGLDAVGAWPPVSESHVEMDGAWALYEAWVKIQMGYAETALVYGVSFAKSF